MLRALGSAWRCAREAVSFSSTRLQQTTGTHIHRIDHYPKVADMSVSLTDKRIESAPFVVGGHEWQLHLYPNGTAAAAGGGPAAVDLVLKGGPWWDLFYESRSVTAAYEVSVIDGEGKWVCDRAVGPRRFRTFSLTVDEPVRIAKAEELRSAAIRGGKDGGGDDSLVVRCDLTVMSLEE